MKHILLFFLAVTSILAQTTSTPINNGKLLNNLDANGKSIPQVSSMTFGTTSLPYTSPVARIHFLPGGAPTTNADGIKWGTAGVQLYQSATGTLKVVGNLLVTGTVSASDGIVSLAGSNTFTGSNTYTSTVSMSDLTLNGTFAVANDTVRDTVRAALALTPGTNVQAYSSRLNDIAAASPTANYILIGNGTTWVSTIPASARSSLGLGTGNNVTFTNGTLTGTLSVTGVSSLTGKLTVSGGIQFGTGGTWSASGSGSTTSDPVSLGSTLVVTGATTLQGVVNIGNASDLQLSRTGSAAATLNGSLAVTTLTTTSSPIGVASGGTGLSGITQYYVPYADSTNHYSQIATGAKGRALLATADTAAALAALTLDSAGGDLTGTYPNPTIATNAVALTTDTTGNYVATLADSGAGSFTITNGSTEGGAATLAVAANGITLNSMTNGDYVATVTAGTGVTITGSGTEARAATISIGQAVATTSSPTFANITAATITLSGTFSAASFNKLVITQPATAATLTISNNKILAVTNTITFSGTDSTTMTFPPADAMLLPSTLTTNGVGLANSIWGASGGLVFEGATANAFNGLLTCADVTAARTWTLPDASTNLIGDDTTTTLTNKTYSAAIFTNGWTASGSTSFDLSGATATFKTPSGLTTVSGAATVVGITTPTGGVAAAGGFSVSPRQCNTGAAPAVVSTDGFDATPSITETYISEIYVPTNCTITGIAVFNGSATGSGNITVGLATSAGAPITAAKSASTVISGTDAYQLVPFATPYAAVGPATYYIQVQYSSATTRYNAHTLGHHGVTKQTGQTYGTFTSFSAPTTFTTQIGNMCGLY